jgi:hypothetical protein
MTTHHSTPQASKIRPGPRNTSARIIQWLLLVKAILLMSLLGQRLYQIDVVQQMEARELTPRQAESLLAGSGWGLAEVPNMMITIVILILLAFWSEKLLTILGLMNGTKRRVPRQLAAASWAIPGLWAIVPRMTLGEQWKASRSAKSTMKRQPILLSSAWLLYHGALLVGYVVSSRALESRGFLNNDVAVYDNLHIPFGSVSLSVVFSLASIAGTLLMIPAIELMARRFESRRLEYLAHTESPQPSR